MAAINSGPFTDWLKEQGRFGQFKKRREQLEDDGMPKYKAWETAAREFGWFKGWVPPSEPSSKPEPEESAADSAEDSAEELQVQSGSADFERDLGWAYEHIADYDVGPADAPSSAAWFLREYGRDHQAKFLEACLKVSARLAEQDSEEREVLEDDGRTEFPALDRLAAETPNCPNCGKVLK